MGSVRQLAFQFRQLAVTVTVMTGNPAKIIASPKLRDPADVNAGSDLGKR
jgi:hypothetical protein